MFPHPYWSGDRHGVGFIQLLAMTNNLSGRGFSHPGHQSSVVSVANLSPHPVQLLFGDLWIEFCEQGFWCLEFPSCLNFTGLPIETDFFRSIAEDGM
jgi:hypothetical protein